MGLPAVRHDTPSRVRHPRLALVDAPGRASRPSRAGGHPRVCQSARCHATFRTFVAVAVLFCGLGLARVALSSRAAAVSIESGRLREKVKESRFVGDSLEIKISQLATPSRIRTIAGKKMKMAQPAGISYMTIDGVRNKGPAAPPRKAARSPQSKANDKTGESLLSSIMNTAAGEAQVLLLGDVGLASSR